jgi:hypothetical protein
MGGAMIEPREQETIEGYALRCRSCGESRWVYIDDRDNGDWVESNYQCAGCGHIEYVELPD